MVAKIESGKSLIGALNYNEQKVKAGKAFLLDAVLYVKDKQSLTFYDKLFRLTDLAERNHRTKTNTVHLSLNFDRSENLDDHLLARISETYMRYIGFGDQPYLLYRHTDAGHPHIHILTTNIKSSGERISLHNIGEEKSEPARKAVEAEFQLVRAETQQRQFIMEPVAIAYQEGDIKRRLTNIVNRMIADYRFGSLAEFNAVLGRFRVRADRGSEKSTMHRKGGLLYWVLNERQEKTGVPIKASSIYRKPTLKLLEARFQMNDELRRPFKEPLKRKIDQAIAQSRSITEFQKNLQQQRADLICRINADGRLYGVTFIDDDTKCVFKGSDLGKAFSANALTVRLDYNQATQANAGGGGMIRTGQPSVISEPVASIGFELNLLELLMKPEFEPDQLPADLRKSRKKKKRKLNL